MTVIHTDLDGLVLIDQLKQELENANNKLREIGLTVGMIDNIDVILENVVQHVKDLQADYLRIHKEKIGLRIKLRELVEAVERSLHSRWEDGPTTIAETHRGLLDALRAAKENQ
jgi:chromosome condensin MukBEF ATPase and DNA-binding subunit MukB